MRLHQHRVLVIAFAFCTAVAVCAAVVAVGDGEARSKALAALARGKNQLLSARTVFGGPGGHEAQTTSDQPGKRPHPWAGRYYCGAGLAGRDYVVLSAPSRITCTLHYCMGPPVSDCGTVVEISKNRLRAKFQNKSTGLLFTANSGELVIVPWGDRRYLIPVEDMMEFVSAVNQGTEPRYCLFPLLAGDENKQVRGKPELPEEFARLILDRPIRAKIVAIGKPVVEEGADRSGRYYKVEATIDRGKSDGVLPGMEFPYDEVDLHGVFDVTNRVVSVQDKTAVVALVLARRPEDGARKPRLGWRLSTRPMSPAEWFDRVRQEK